MLLLHFGGLALGCIDSDEANIHFAAFSISTSLSIIRELLITSTSTGFLISSLGEGFSSPGG